MSEITISQKSHLENHQSNQFLLSTNCFFWKCNIIIQPNRPSFTSCDFHKSMLLLKLSTFTTQFVKLNDT